MKIYYYGHKITQFAQIYPLLNKLGGKLVISHPFNNDYLKAIIKFGYFHTRFFIY